MCIIKRVIGKKSPLQ
jgi:hypothetical protein